MHARRAAQRIYFQAGIIGQYKIGCWLLVVGCWLFRCQPLRQFNRLLRRIAGKRRGVLDNLRRIGKIVEREKLE